MPRGKNLGVTSLGSSTDFLTQALAGKAGMTTDPTVAQMVNAGDAKVLVDMRTEEGTRAALGAAVPTPRSSHR